MTKGSYTVGDDGTRPPPRKDTSYRSFICVLLIFLGICLIILLITLFWGKGQSDQRRDNGVEWKNLAQTGRHDTEDVERTYKPPEGKKVEDETTTKKADWTTKVPTTEVVESIGNVTRTNKTHEGMKMVDETTTEKEDWRTRQPTTRTIRNVTDSIQFTFTPTESTEAEELATELKTVGITEDVRQVTDSNQFSFASREVTEQNNLTTRLPIVLILRTTKKIPIVTPINNFLTNGTTIKSFDNSTTLESTESTEEIEASNTTEKIKLIITSRMLEPTSEVTEEIGVTNTSNASKIEDITPKSVTEKVSNVSTTITNGKSEEAEEAPTTLPARISTTTTTTTTSTTETTPVRTTTTSTTETTPVTRPTTTTSSTGTTPVTRPTTTTSTTEISIMESDFTEPDISPLTDSTSSTEASSVLQSVSSPLVNSSKPVCTTPVCKSAASRILSMMNHSSEPCVDFSEFACGNFYQKPEDSSEFQEAKLLDEELHKVGSSSEKFLKDFQSFYQSCMEYDDHFNYRQRMQGLEALLDEVGQFQLNSSKEVDLTDLVSSLILRQSMPLFDIGLDVDKQSSNFILQLNLPYQSFLRTTIDNWSGLSMLKYRCLHQQHSRMHDFNINLNTVYSYYQNCQGDYSTYLDSLETVIRDLTAFSNLQADLLKEIKEIRFTIEFEVLNNLDSLPSSATILSNFINKSYQMRKVSDLQQHYPLFDWKRLFQILTGHEIQDSTLVQVYFDQYFQKVFSHLDKVDKRKLNNAFLAIHSYDLFINTVISKGKSARNQFCVDLSKKLLPDVWSHLVHKAIPASQQEYNNQQVTKLFGELKKTFCKSLLDSEWIDDDTKVAINKKCNDLNVATSLPPDIRSLTRNYEILNITQNYQSNLKILLTNFKKMVYSTEGKPLSAREIFSYFLDPMSRKPLTFYASPMIAVPLGLMKKSQQSLPDYLVKTKAGFSLARQLARHFDTKGMTYGVTLKSVSKSSYSEFVHTMTNLMDYSSPRMFHDKNITFLLKGSLSLNERIVDNTAFRLVYDSLDFHRDGNILPWISAQYSREKVFFIAAAQELCKKTSMLDFMLQVFEQRHLPAVLRVENIIGNSQQFATQFSCPAGSGMDFPIKLQFPHLEIQEEEEYQEENDNLEQRK